MKRAESAGVFGVAHGAGFDAFDGVDGVDDVQECEFVWIEGKAEAACYAAL